MKIKSLFGIVAVVSATVLSMSCSRESVYSVEHIWGGDEAYCAFTSLAECDGTVYCTFREGGGHVFDNTGKAEGKIRVISSRDGKKWESVALLSKEGYDLRDPKISVMPDGTLMLLFGGSIYQGTTLKFQGTEPMVSFSRHGEPFSEPENVVFVNEAEHRFGWLWDIKWHEGTGYSVNYDVKTNEALELYKTTDGVHFEMVCDLLKDLGNEEWLTETAVEFLPDGRMALMVRCDSGSYMGWWGTAEAPFTDWKWSRMDYQLGGPDFIPYNGGIIAASRMYLPKSIKKTVVYLGNEEGWLFPVIMLPSDRDSSYPGMLLKDDELWISYYSSHECKKYGRDWASIYLAKIPLKMLENQTPVL